MCNVHPSVFTSPLNSAVDGKLFYKAIQRDYLSFQPFIHSFVNSLNDCFSATTIH